ncbi:MAG TPA: hypothetical protein PKD37_07115 [Oligoflexia bacterium]|nr:hypothetical protein [Oligoflexia bacterium]HMP27733.1 hypothetical protein [Oligoflexia bacterium]
MFNLFSFKISLFALGLQLLAGCTATSVETTRKEVVDISHIEYQSAKQREIQKRNQQGVVEYVWEEPMVDVIDVPPGLDPEGHYYRPAHRSIVEIRQGRYQYYKPSSESAEN